MTEHCEALLPVAPALSTPTKGRRFAQVIVTLAALCVALITASLGAWQLGRAQEKKAWEASMQARAMLPALQNGDVVAQQDLPAQWLHRQVHLQGEWLPAFTVFLDNRQMHGKPGFFVVTPFRLQATGTVIAVERGWAPRDFMERERLPRITTPEGLVAIHGRIVTAPARLWEFRAQSNAASPTNANAPRIRQNLALDRWQQETGLPLVRYALQQLDGDLASGRFGLDDAAFSTHSVEGLLRNWPEPASGVHKHYGYAAQWFAMSMLVVVLYGWFQYVRPRWGMRREQNATPENNKETQDGE